MIDQATDTASTAPADPDTACSCGHPARDHTDKVGLDGRAGCVRADGLARCGCRKTPAGVALRAAAHAAAQPRDLDDVIEDRDAAVFRYAYDTHGRRCGCGMPATNDDGDLCSPCSADLEQAARARLLAAGGRDHSSGATDVVFVVMVDDGLDAPWVLGTCATAVFAEGLVARHGADRCRADLFPLLP